MVERDDARRSIEDARERMSEIAEELARRANPDRLRAMAKEEAVKRGKEFKDRAVNRGRDVGTRVLSSPPFIATVGGVLGSVAGAMAARRFAQSHEEIRSWQGASDRYGFGTGGAEILVEEDVRVQPDVASSYPASSYEDTAGYEGSSMGSSMGGSIGSSSGSSSGGGGLTDKAGEIRSKVSERSHELRDRASSAAEDLKSRASEISHRMRDRMPSGGDIKVRSRDVVQRVERHPGFLLLGGLIAGAAAALLLPVTDVERQRVGPLRERARETIRSATEEIEERAFAGGGSQNESSYESSTVH